MKLFGMLLVFALANGAQAATPKIVTCQKARVGLTSLVGPVGETSRYFHNNQVAVYSVDQMEPVCCSAGVAITLPDMSADLPGDQKCVAILGFSGVDVKNARSSYDPAKGLLLEIDTREYTGRPGGKPGQVLRVRLNMENSKITLE